MPDIYLLDTNVVINAFNLYPKHIFVSYWNFFEKRITNGQFVFHEKVRDEILKKEDEKSQWFSRFVPNEQIIRTDSAELESYKLVTSWAIERQTAGAYEIGAQREFLNAADSWLVASARSRLFTIVSNERPNSNSKKKIKIPDAAREFGVDCITGLEMLARERVTF
uniref:DUF4411 family protein n=1 Tax=Vaginimicrobium propionicum TaxID=1871034 RepID=UPI0013902B69|nr:DUF4411 family protein [Vaginimicrobium propionicum]